MKKPQQILTSVILAALLSACNLPARPTATPIINQALAGTIVAMTLESLQNRSPNISLTAQNPPIQNSTTLNSPLPTSTIVPVVTITQTLTITPTFSEPLLTFDGNTNCREGPGTNYKVVTVLKAGQSIEPLGTQGNYWIVKVPGGQGSCWVASDFATPSGSTWTLTTMTAPPPPTGEPPAAPSWSKWNFNCVFAPGGFTVTMNLLWTDLSNNETGFKVYRDGQEIATLAADVNSYTDVAFVENGKTLEYYVEVYKDTANSSTSAISASCQ